MLYARLSIVEASLFARKAGCVRERKCEKEGSVKCEKGAIECAQVISNNRLGRDRFNKRKSRFLHITSV